MGGPIELILAKMMLTQRKKGVVLTDQAGEQAWPITGASFILLHARQDKPENGREVLRFFDWAFRNGGDAARRLDYIPVPDPVHAAVRAAWSGVKAPGGQQVWSA